MSNVDFDVQFYPYPSVLNCGVIGPTKTSSLYRTIGMSPPVYDALRKQWKFSGNKSAFVFATGMKSFDHRNVTRRSGIRCWPVWDWKSEIPIRPLHAATFMAEFPVKARNGSPDKWDMPIPLHACFGSIPVMCPKSGRAGWRDSRAAAGKQSSSRRTRYDQDSEPWFSFRTGMGLLPGSSGRF